MNNEEMEIMEIEDTEEIVTNDESTALDTVNDSLAEIPEDYELDSSDNRSGCGGLVAGLIGAVVVGGIAYAATHKDELKSRLTDAAAIRAERKRLRNEVRELMKEFKREQKEARLRRSDSMDDNVVEADFETDEEE